MSHIQRLSIQGIRSFSPDEPQEIRFLPLTIIIGPNGAGKTTIIESLRYVTTGQMPPNCNSGKTFIHDIHYQNKPLIRGQIRLSFMDIENKCTIITRSMQANMRTVKNKTSVTFRQMNAVIKREGKSIDQKLADINNELMELIGVTKPVLNNVIFCHQEDINWPLSEGKALKEKIDDIFGSIAFSKALEKIKKCRDEECTKLKLLEKDVIYAQQIKKEADKRKKAMAEENGKLNAEKERAEQLQNKIDEFKAKVDSLTEKEGKVEQIFSRMSQIEGSINELKKQMSELEERCSIEFSDLTKEEIDQKLENYDNDVLNASSRKKEVEMKIKNIDSEYESCFAKKQQFSSHVAKIQECENQINTNYQQFTKLVADIPELSKTEYANYDPKSLDNTRIIDKIKDILFEKVSTTQTFINNENKEFNKNETEINRELDSFKYEKSEINYAIKIGQEKIEQAEKNLKQIESEAGVQHFQDYINTLNMEIANFSSQLAKYDSQKEKDLKTNIDNLEKEKESLKRESSLLSSQILIANEKGHQKLKYQFLIDQKTEKNSKMDLIKMNHLGTFMKVGANEDFGFAKKLLPVIKEKTLKLDQVNSLVINKEKKLHSEKDRLAKIEANISNKMLEVNNIVKKLDGICAPEEFLNFINNIDQQLLQLRNEKSNYEHFAPLMEKFIGQINKDKACPICEHDLSSEWMSKVSGKKLEANILLDNLHRLKNDNSNKKLADIQQQITDKEDLFNRMLVMKTEVNSIPQLKELIQNLEKEKNSVLDDINSLESGLKIERTKINMEKGEIEHLNNSIQDATDYDNYLNDLKEIKDKLNNLDYNEDDDFDFTELNHQFQQKELELKSCDLKLSKFQKELINMTSERMKLQELLQTVERKKAEHEKNEQNQILNASKMDKLNAEIKENQNNIPILNSKLTNVSKSIEEMEQKLKLEKNRHDSQINKLRTDLIHYQTQSAEFDRVVGEINNYAKQLIYSQSEIPGNYLEEIDSKLKELQDTKKNLAEDMNRFNQIIAKYELNKRNLVDCQKLFNLKEEIGRKEKLLREAYEKVGGTNIQTFRNQRIEAERGWQDLVTQQNVTKTHIVEWTEKIEKLRDELNEDEYRDANEKYKTKCIERTISELACEDLDKYYKALDFAITTFHRNKMEAINQLLEQFWKVSYQGQDIESIQIMADEEERSASEKRRNYNYRVVMVKNGKELDMRGRCSAGQKVLACIIIRLALAMIFSNNFSLITLDEPTTNLDDANVRALARALITLRKMNPNLQIVIITHDEDFLQFLTGNEDTQYYKVYKNEDGYSTIAYHKTNAE